MSTAQQTLELADDVARCSFAPAPGSESFDQWWKKNHPCDWWAAKRHGEPLPSWDRLLVWELCKRAYEHPNAAGEPQP